MVKIFWQALLTAPAFFGAIMFASSVSAATVAEATENLEVSNVSKVEAFSASIASEPSVLVADASPVVEVAPVTEATQAAPVTSVAQLEAATGENSMGQVTSVNQLSDVSPTDWAYQSLQSLVERYGCIVGYPDRTYRGNRALSRYEFAAGLNACLDRVNELIAQGTADLVRKEDLAALQRLQEEFAAELATLRGRVDALEARTATLEAQQFSTTTKLEGEVLFLIGGLIDGDGIRAVPTGMPIDSNNRTQENTFFGSRVRLSFNTSFTGKDRLRTRLQFRNFTLGNSGAGGAESGTRQTRLGTEGTTNGNFELDDLAYRFPVFDGKGQVNIAARTEFDRIFPTIVPFDSSGSGALSRFGRYNNTYRANGGAGATFRYKFSDAFQVDLGYLAGDANLTEDSTGLFGGNYTALGQLTFKPSSSISIALLYARSYYNESVSKVDVNLSGSTGTEFARRPFDNKPTTSNDYSIQAAWRVSRGFELAGWYTFKEANREGGPGNADIQQWAVQLAFRDLLNKGDRLGIIVGQPFWVTSNSIASRRDDVGSFHIEAFYRFQVTDNIQITPGFYYITNPEGNRANDNVWVYAIRTRFSF